MAAENAFADLAIEFLLTVLQPVWFEFAMFGGTLLVAYIFQQYFAHQKANAAKKKTLHLAEPHGTAPTIRPHAEDQRSIDTHRSSSLPRPQQRGGARTLTPACNDPLRTFEEVCESVQRGSPARRLTAALEAYSEMRQNGLDQRVHELEKRSRYSAADFYNALAQCSVRVGKPHLLEQLVVHMRGNEVQRSLSFYESAMKILAGKKYYKEALRMHSLLLEDGLEPSPVTCSCLINFAVEIGELDQAISFFEKLSSMDRPSIRAYMTILRVYAKRHDWKRSIEILGDMRTRGLEPDSLVANIVLATCVHSEQTERAEELLLEMQGEGGARKILDVVSFNTVIKGYAQKGEFEKALATLEQMSGHALQPNMITFNTVMDAAVRCKRPTEAWRVLKSMRDSGLSPDKYSCSILVKGLHAGSTPEQIRDCLGLLQGRSQTDNDNQLMDGLFQSLMEASISTKDVSLMLEVVQQMKKAALSPNAGAYGVLLRALVAAGEFEACQRVWQDMLSTGALPSQPSFASVVEAYAGSDQAELCIQLYEGVRRAAGNNDHGYFTTLIRALCKSRRADLAMRAYRDVKMKDQLSKEHELDLATYVTLIKAHCDAGSIEDAFAIAKDIEKAGLKPDEQVLNALLTACFKEAKLDLGKRAFDELIRAGARPNPASFATMVKLLGRCQQLQDALALFESMEPQHGVAPSCATYAALMHACVRNKQTGRALDLLAQMRDRLSCSPDNATYSLLINACVSSGQHLSAGVRLADEALQQRIDISPDVIQNLITAGLRRQPPAALLEQIRQLVQTHNVPINEKISERLSS